MIEQIELGKTYYLPVRVTEFNHEVGDEELTVRLGNLSGRHQLVDFGKIIMNELVEIDLRLDQPKLVVPQMIFDVIESFDDDVDYLHEHMGCQSDEVREWLTHNERDFYEAWLAYPNITVEKSK